MVRPLFPFINSSLKAIYLSILSICVIIDFFFWLSISSRYIDTTSFNASFICTTDFSYSCFFLVNIPFHFLYFGSLILHIHSTCLVVLHFYSLFLYLFIYWCDLSTIFLIIPFLRIVSMFRHTVISILGGYF